MNYIQLFKNPNASRMDPADLDGFYTEISRDWEKRAKELRDRRWGMLEDEASFYRA